MNPDLSPEHLAETALIHMQHEGRPPLANEEEFASYWLDKALGEQVRLGKITRKDAQVLLEAGWIELQRRLSAI